MVKNIVFGSGAVTVKDRLNAVRSSGNRVDTSKVSTRTLTIDPEIMGVIFGELIRMLYLVLMVLGLQ